MLLQAYRCFSIVLFFICLAAYINMLNARETHIVGDGGGWSLFTDSNNWAEGKEFHVGDFLVFNYESGLHNVLQVNSTAYEGCIKDPYIQIFNSGNDSLLLSEVDRIWFICGVTDHCENGQKLSIIVVP
ncbi:Blue copper protein [Quillaja saponaria]|uniref:Blue copper protein n=1 Tax=Quillaja saponaria TaxID=32244 RepID=A0AAD7Q5M0_QUISA|nr:Blue copper protein [Quillaja saponaria]